MEDSALKLDKYFEEIPQLLKYIRTKTVESIIQWSKIYRHKWGIQGHIAFVIL